ncbi:MAG TPA: 50S ribosomal protein L9 [Kiloniellales bacterium]|jgi:large subunit ribosomal protein L9
MQVILLERIEKLGQMGDVVSVKPGYARNYLLPQRKARRATKENLALFEKHRAQLEAENLTRRDEAQKVGEKLDGLAVTLIRQAGESGQLYGSVTSRDLAEAATAAGFTVARTQILLDMVIKTLGLHTIRVRLHPEVTVTVTANVARSDAEAEAQAKSGHIVSAEEREAVAAAAASAKEAALSALEVDQAEADEADAGEAEDSAKGE